MGGDAAKQRKVAALQNEVSALEAALEAARREYERVKARNLQVGAGECSLRHPWLLVERCAHGMEGDNLREGSS